MHRAKEAGKGGIELFDPAAARACRRPRCASSPTCAARSAPASCACTTSRSGRCPTGAWPASRRCVRWEHPERGLVSPRPSSSRSPRSSGLIVPIGTWVLREACRQFAAWRRDLPAAADLLLRVNLSARQVTQPGLIDDRRAPRSTTTASTAAPLGLEITEGLLLQDSDVGRRRRCAGCKELGVKLVLDDFGTGYSSLSYLKRFPIDQLKIDRSFVFELEERDENRALVAAIVGMAAALGLSVVARGRRDRGPARRAAGARLRVRPGLPARPPARGRRRRAAPHRSLTHRLGDPPMPARRAGRRVVACHVQLSRRPPPPSACSRSRHPRARSARSPTAARTRRPRRPTRRITAGPTNPTTDTRPSFTFGSSLSFSRFECRWSSADPWFECASGYRPPAAQPEGTHTLTVRACNDYETEDGVPFFLCDETPASLDVRDRHDRPDGRLRLRPGPRHAPAHAADVHVQRRRGPGGPGGLPVQPRHRGARRLRQRARRSPSR